MKKFVVLILSLAMIVSTAAVAMAEVEVGGDLRVLYNVTEETNNFNFHRLALVFKSAISENNGFTSEVQFRQVAKAENILLDKAYYYQTDIFGADELNIGYLPASWHGENTITIYSSLGDHILAP